MTNENSGMREHIRRTLDAINQFDGSVNLMQQKLLSQFIGDQYEVLIDLSAAELRAIAPNPGAANVAVSSGFSQEAFIPTKTAGDKS